jgi:hypothetical protein
MVRLFRAPVLVGALGNLSAVLLSLEGVEVLQAWSVVTAEVAAVVSSLVTHLSDFSVPGVTGGCGFAGVARGCGVVA